MEQRKNIPPAKLQMAGNYYNKHPAKRLWAVDFKNIIQHMGY